MGELHAKFHQNWWSGFRDIAFHDTDGHSFIIIRMINAEKCQVLGHFFYHPLVFYEAIYIHSEARSYFVGNCECLFEL